LGADQRRVGDLLPTTYYSNKVSMLSLVYSSTATVDFTDADLMALLVASRNNNDFDGITGVLAFRDGRFLQLLEGPMNAVRDRMRIIEHDPRHTQVTVLMEEVTQTRQFPDWTMGFPAVEPGQVDDVPGYRATFDGLAHSGSGGGTLLALRQLLGWYAKQAA
jgi:hypothetical protein